MTDETTGDGASGRQQTPPRTRWGRVRFGDGSLGAMRVAVPAGVVLAPGIGAVSVATGVAGPRPLLGGIVFALVTVCPLVGLVWALVVDRMTLQGATERPEDSVESAWGSAAAGSSFTDTMTFAGLFLAALAVTGREPSALAALSAVLVFAALSYAARYLLARRAG